MTKRKLKYKIVSPRIAGEMTRKNYMRKKILLLDQADFIGGAELFNLDLINNFNLEKFEVFLLFSGNPEYQKRIQQHLNEYAYPLPRIKKSGFFKYWNLLKSVWLIRTIVQREKIEIIQSNTIRTHILSALSKKLFRLNVQLIWFVHDFTFPQKVLRKLIKLPDLILTCSEIVKKDLLLKTADIYSPKIQIVYNGVLPKNPPKEDPRMQALQNFLRTGTPRDLTKKHKIGMIGRLDEWKGQDVFVEAAGIVLAKTKKVEFLLIGSASEYDQATVKFAEKLQKMVKKLNLEKSVKFLGYVENLEKEMRNLEIVVHASKQAEPFGRVIIEAMNLGKVVIASDLGGTKEIIQNGIDGYLIPANDAKILAEKILEVLKNPNSRQKIEKNARAKIASKFVLKEQIKKIESHWEKLVGS